MKMLLLRPYYGITVHSDMHGDLGIADCYTHVFPDISLVLSATVASKCSSVELDVIDANAEKLLPKDVLLRLNESYDLIVIKAAAVSVKYDIEFARALKARYPHSKLIFGGHAAKVLHNWLRKNVAEIDDISCEPLEYYIYKLLNNTSSVCLNDLPAPDYSLLPYKDFKDFDGLVRASLYMSRGCTTGCTYCPHFAFYGNKIDSRSVEKVIEDIKGLLKLGISNIEFKDQFFTINRDTTAELCEQIIENKLNIKWRCQTRLETLDRKLIDLMVKSGLEILFFGVESASEETLKSFNRPSNNKENMKDLINYLNEKGVTTIAFYIIGFPEDTWESINDTFELSVELKSISANYFIYNPYVFNDSSFSSLKIAPDLFGVFENNLLVDASKNLSMEELKFLEFQLPILYKIKTAGLETAYNYEYCHKQRYKNELSEKIKKLKECSIFEI
ncbi:MAG TPA: B12-binding domain-containing radical SAM protein [Clostridia bacterium]